MDTELAKLKGEIAAATYGVEVIMANLLQGDEPASTRSFLEQLAMPKNHPDLSALDAPARAKAEAFLQSRDGALMKLARGVQARIDAIRGGSAYPPADG